MYQHLLSWSSFTTSTNLIRLHARGHSIFFIIDYPQEGRATPSNSAVLGQPVEELKQASDHLPGIKKLM